MVFSKLKIRLNIASFILLIIMAIFMILAVNYFQKEYAIATAEKKSLILLQHNLAFHSYFNNQLKPKLFAFTEGIRGPDFFDPVWMSSTYAAREIDNIYDDKSAHRYYYKEAAINARSPQNEADDFERDFILRLNKDQKLQNESDVRLINGKPYFYTIMRGEVIENGCMRCHSTPDKAPGNMVKTYGATLSFNRSADEVVSAISIHIPLAEAYSDADQFSIKLSGVLVLLLLVVFILQNRLLDRLVLIPLQNFRSQAESISNDIENLGVAIPEVFTDEMNDIAGSFNKMSYRLKAIVDGLDDTIQGRTAALTASEAKYRLLFENMANSFALHQMIYNTQGNPSDYRFIEVNPAFETQTGLKASDIVGRTVLDIMPNTEKSWIDIYGKVAANGEPISFENFSREIGRYYQVWAYCPKPGYFATIFNDITERKRDEEEKSALEGQLHQAQKMESVGSLAGGVAHDFNNKLSVILGCTYLASIESDPIELKNILEEIRKAAESSADLTRQLLAFARKQTIIPKVLDLNETVAGMFKMLNRLIGEDIRLAWHPADELWLLKFDPSQIDQILANLCVNARDSITKDGKITIETGNSIIDASYCTFNTYASPGEYVRIVVGDNGSGMDNETQQRIFEPFFTTKETGKGTGLGLAMVFGIVKQNNGFINVCSEPGIGTTFSIYLPRYVGETEQKQNDAKSMAAPLGQETILLVEDEQAILNMASLVLVKQNYSVLKANNPAEAIRLAEEHLGEISLLITDVIMPEMNGKELANKLQSTNPRLKCLFMSGYTADAISQYGVLDEGVDFIQKPFSLPEFGTKVRKVLDDK
jgi:PAS domain S-box-containing protein